MIGHPAFNIGTRQDTIEKINNALTIEQVEQYRKTHSEEELEMLLINRVAAIQLQNPQHVSFEEAKELLYRLRDRLGIEKHKLI